MDTRSFVVAELSLFAWREGNRLAPGSRDAQLAIAFVISNRQKAGWDDGDWLKILSRVAVHSASEAADMVRLDYPDVWEPNWRWLSSQVDGIYDGTLHDDLTSTPGTQFQAVNAATHSRQPVNQSKPSFFYANLNFPIRPWFLEKIIRNSAEHPRTVEIPPIVFFN